MIRGIFACDRENGIGKNGTLPWPHNSEDLKWFKRSTKNCVVVMGRRTWNDPLMPAPLPDRYNIVLTTKDLSTGPKMLSGPNMIFQEVDSLTHTMTLFQQDVWVIGGSTTFKALMHVCEELWISRINGVYDCDTHLSDMCDYELFHKEYDVDKNLRIEKYRRSI
mgnify:FL=1